MEFIIKICAAAIISVILIGFLKNCVPELGSVAVLTTSILIFLALLPTLNLALEYFESIFGKINYGREYFSIVLKVLAITYITELGASLCEDAGQKSIASKIELAGRISVFTVAIPVFSSLLSMISSLQ